jgi:hypothetical protein
VLAVLVVIGRSTPPLPAVDLTLPPTTRRAEEVDRAMLENREVPFELASTHDDKIPRRSEDVAGAPYRRHLQVPERLLTQHLNVKWEHRKDAKAA